MHRNINFIFLKNTPLSKVKRQVCLTRGRNVKIHLPDKNFVK